MPRNPLRATISVSMRYPHYSPSGLTVSPRRLCPLRHGELGWGKDQRGQMAHCGEVLQQSSTCSGRGSCKIFRRDTCRRQSRTSLNFPRYRPIRTAPTSNPSRVGRRFTCRIDRACVPRRSEQCAPSSTSSRTALSSSPSSRRTRAPMGLNYIDGVGRTSRRSGTDEPALEVPAVSSKSRVVGAPVNTGASTHVVPELRDERPRSKVRPGPSQGRWRCKARSAGASRHSHVARRHGPGAIADRSRVPIRRAARGVVRTQPRRAHMVHDDIGVI
jgi:hypothetical protein